MHRLVVLSILVGVSALIAGAAPQDPHPLAGRWLGKVVANIGEMPIEVVITVADAMPTGEIRNVHGAFKIGRVSLLKDGRWELPFTADDGSTGKMTGAVKDDAFAGEWDYRPRAVGTFQLSRAK